MYWAALSLCESKSLDFYGFANVRRLISQFSRIDTVLWITKSVIGLLHSDNREKAAVQQVYFSALVWKSLPLYNRTCVCYPVDRRICFEKRWQWVEDQIQNGTYHDRQVNIPIQLLSVTDRDGRITPLWFRLETEEHEIRKFQIEDIISRDEKNYVGVKEKQFVCRIRQGERSRTLEMRYNTVTQRWRIFQFL